MEDKVIGFFKSCLECIPLLFCANISGRSGKEIRNIRIAEIVVGTVISAIILGGFGSVLVLQKMETAFNYQSLFINTKFEALEQKRVEDKQDIRRELDNIRYDIKDIEKAITGG